MITYASICSGPFLVSNPCCDIILQTDALILTNLLNIFNGEFKYGKEENPLIITNKSHLRDTINGLIISL
ncbi:hypothetical protein HZS_3297 [Henneguya salminicola]|nr:hypothetical protein HZS_3297 [Henneguya salminicola]